MATFPFFINRSKVTFKDNLPDIHKYAVSIVMFLKKKKNNYYNSPGKFHDNRNRDNWHSNDNDRRESNGTPRLGEKRKQPDEDSKPLTVAGKKIVTAIVNEIEIIHGKDILFAFDGHDNAYASKQLSLEQGPLIVNLELQKIRYQVTFKDTKTVPLHVLKKLPVTNDEDENKVQECITALQAIFRTPCLINFLVAGDKFSIPPRYNRMFEHGGKLQPLDMGAGIVGYYTFSFSFFAEHDAVYLQFMAHIIPYFMEQRASDLYRALSTTFPEEDCGAAMRKRIFEQAFSKRSMEEVFQAKQTNGRRVFFKSTALSLKTPKDLTVGQNGRTIQQIYSYAGYEITEQGLNEPCIGTGKDKHFPLECCVIRPDQRAADAFYKTIQPKLVNENFQDPSQHFEAINNVYKEIKNIFDPYTTGFGIELPSDVVLTKITGRILPPPDLQFGNNQVFKYDEKSIATGKIPFDRHTRLYQPAEPLKDWGVLLLTDEVSKSDIKDGMLKIVSRANMMGWDVQLPTAVRYHPSSSIKTGLLNMRDEVVKKNGRCQMLLVIKISTARVDYNHIKEFTETRIGVITQCVTAQTFKTLSDEVVTQLVLKMNSKFGGVAWRIPTEHFEVLRPRTSVLGIATYNSSTLFMKEKNPKDENVNEPMTGVTMVSSTDVRVGRYLQTSFIQSSVEPYVNALGDMFVENMIKFENENGFLPDRFIIFRHGLSKSIAEEILEEEIDKARKAYRKEFKKIAHFTYIVCTKANRLRILPTENAPRDDTGNCIPGTLIESLEEHNPNNEFYLVSNAVNIGSKTPMQYRVVTNELNVPMEDIYKLTHNLCFLTNDKLATNFVAMPYSRARKMAERKTRWQEARDPRFAVENINKLLKTPDSYSDDVDIKDFPIETEALTQWCKGDSYFH